MLVKVRLGFKEPKKIFRFDKVFKEKTEPSERAIGVSEAFGIDVGVEREEILYQDLAIDIEPKDVIYITGDSGTGKSTLLKDLAEALGRYPAFGRVLQDKDVEINQDYVLVEGLGSTLEEAIQYLSLAGLNDATLFVRRYRDLSEGQKYRFKIAKMLSIGADTLIFDEFCSLLDRETAKVVAYCVQKMVRKVGATLIIATSHRDLFEDLQPDIYIVKGFGREIQVKYCEADRSRPCTILREVEIKEGTPEDLHSLEAYHYRGGRLHNIRRIYKAELRGETIGVIAYSTPLYSCAGRTKYFGRRVNVEELNRDFITISRVIVHPKYRGIGLGVKLVKETLEKTGYRYVEAVAVMARYNPFFKKAGMAEVPYTSTLSLKCREALKILSDYTIDSRLAASKLYITKKLQTLNKNQLQELTSRILNLNTTHYILDLVLRRSEQSIKQIDNLATLIQKTAIIAQSKLYYIWENQHQRRKP
jgi:ABC-type ATPase with predicted acetyltransferase domain